MKPFLWSALFKTDPVRARDAFVFLLINVAISTVLLGVVWMGIGSAQPLAIALGGSILLSIIGSLFAAVWTHIWVFALGGRGVEKTASVVWMASAFAALFGWAGQLPVIGRFIHLAIILVSIGIFVRRLRVVMPSKRAYVAVALSVVSALALFIGIAIWAIIIFFPTLFAL